jgi:hypothetical protein
MIKVVLFLTGILLILSPSQYAHAYLDPASGSMLLQLLLGGVAGIVIVVKLYWERFRKLFQRKSIEPDGLQKDKGEE